MKLIFPSKLQYSTIDRIDRSLRLLYLPTPSDFLWPSKNYYPLGVDEEKFNRIPVRVDEEKFNRILDRVEALLKIFKEDYDVDDEIIETVDAVFKENFIGIINFLYEARNFEEIEFEIKTEDELSKLTPEYIKKRIIRLAYSMSSLGIHTSEF